MKPNPILPAALVAGTVAALTSSLALAAVARAERRGALQPTNSTSHWLNGDGAAAVRRADLRHTAVGAGTHWAATLFWALCYGVWTRRSPDPTPARLLGDAVAVSGLAAAVDYGATPHRFTPGWELVLGRPAMAVVYAAMALGLAGGTLLAERLGTSARQGAAR